MSINNWKIQFEKDFTTKKFEWTSLEENTRNSLAYFTDFIETQISLAEKRWAERMKAQCLAVIPEDNHSHDDYADKFYNMALKHCRQEITLASELS